MNSKKFEIREKKNKVEDTNERPVPCSLSLKFNVTAKDRKDNHNIP